MRARADRTPTPALMTRPGTLESAMSSDRMSIERFRPPAGVALLAVLALAGAACAGDSTSDRGGEAEFAELQERGQVAMGVDQYIAVHQFDALPDGGRIELQHGDDDPVAVATIRDHLLEIRTAFSGGDFTTPAFVHAQEVPGTAVMAARKDRIEYMYRDLPRGGEVRLVTSDAEALEAIRSFMAFQREDHRAGGMDHGTMDHGAMDHGTMDHGAPAAAPMQHDTAGHMAMHGPAGGMGAMHGGGMQHGPGGGMGGMQGGGMQHGPGGGMHGAGGGMGGMGGMHGPGGGMGAMYSTEDPAFNADMDLVHNLLMNHRAITRTVVHLPNGVETRTESEYPEVAALIIGHVASMERRMKEGEVFNLFSHNLPTIFENYDQMATRFGYIETGVTMVQTSDDPEVVRALQAHAAEVTEMVDEGMIVMMRGMMSRQGKGPMGMNREP